MGKYKIIHQKDNDEIEEYEIEAADLSDAQDIVLGKESISIIALEKPIIIKIENQLDKKFAKYYLGKVKTSGFNGHGCYLFSWAYIYSVKMGKQISPIEVDKMFMDNGVYDGDMIISEKAAKVLGLHYYGKEYDINKPPAWSPSIKEVDFSIKNGKSQHFVVREKINGKNVILDPYGGVQRPINYYELKVNDPEWKSRYFNYRLVKI